MEIEIEKNPQEIYQELLENYKPGILNNASTIPIKSLDKVHTIFFEPKLENLNEVISKWVDSCENLRRITIEFHDLKNVSEENVKLITDKGLDLFIYDGVQDFKMIFNGLRLNKNDIGHFKDLYTEFRSLLLTHEIDEMKKSIEEHQKELDYLKQED